MSKLKLVKFIFLLLMVSLAMTSTTYGLMIPQTVQDLSDNSSNIIRGKVLSKISMWNDSHDFIYTRVTFQVFENYVAQIKVNNSIEIWIPGGTVNDTTLYVEHSAEFTVGEEVVVFLTEDEIGYGVTSREQGKYTVSNNTIREKNISVEEFRKQIIATQH